MKHNQKKTLQRKSLVSHGARVVITRARFLTVTELEMKTPCKRKRHNLEGGRLWKVWTVVELTMHFKQVKIVQEFENKVKTMSFGVLSFLKSVTAYLGGRNPRYHDIYLCKPYQE